MNYTISICQKAIIDNDLQIDWLDAAILDFMHKFTLSKKMQRIVLNEETYFYFSYEHIIQENPLLPIKTKDAIRRRLRVLESKGFLVSHPDNQKLCKAFYKFEDKSSLIYADNTYDPKVVPYDPKVVLPTASKSDNQIINNQTIKLKKEGKKEGSASQPYSELSSEEKFIYDSILTVMCSTSKAHSNYILKCINTHRDNNSIEVFCTNTAGFIEYISKSGQIVSSDISKVVKAITSINWQAKLKSMKGGQVTEIEDISKFKEVQTPQDKKYWENLQILLKNKRK